MIEERGGNIALQLTFWLRYVSDKINKDVERRQRRKRGKESSWKNCLIFSHANLQKKIKSGPKCTVIFLYRTYLQTFLWMSVIAKGIRPMRKTKIG